jgi:hypothetical protein
LHDHIRSCIFLQGILPDSFLGYLCCVKTTKFGYGIAYRTIGLSPLYILSWCKRPIYIEADMVYLETWLVKNSIICSRLIVQLMSEVLCVPVVTAMFFLYFVTNALVRLLLYTSFRYG